MSAEVLKSLKIKTGALKRVNKELSYYEKDRVKESERVAKLKADNAEEHDVKQAVRAPPPAAQCGKRWPARRRMRLLPPRRARRRRSAAGAKSRRRSCCCLSSPPARCARPAQKSTPAPARPRPQENVLSEASMMVPETRQRLEVALSDLQAFLVRRRPAAALPAAAPSPRCFAPSPQPGDARARRLA